MNLRQKIEYKLRRVRLVLWVILGRPIIYKCAFKGGIELMQSRNAMISDNRFQGYKALPDGLHRPLDKSFAD